MEIISNKINQIATTEVCPGVINTYTYSQDVGQPVTDIRIEISKNGNKVAGANYMGSSNRLLIDVNDYKFLTRGECKAALSAMLDDIETILADEDRIQ